MLFFRLRSLKNGFIKLVFFHEAPKIIIIILILSSCFNNQHLMTTWSKRLTENHMNCG